MSDFKYSTEPFLDSDQAAAILRIHPKTLQRLARCGQVTGYRIGNPPYMALVIEATDESGPCGLPAISVCHYGEQNGDAMRDPEMCFEFGQAGGAHLNPFYWRNDYAGVEQWSRFIRDGHYVFHTALYSQHEQFAKVWDNNLRLQGFAEAFEQQQTPRA